VTDIKERLEDLQAACGRANIYGTALEPGPIHQLAADALAEIKRLEGVRDHGLGRVQYPEQRQAEALEKIAEALRSIDETVTMWHTDGVPVRR
jgi:hypothetical protein